ncbi:hypothetical protein A2348_00270 [Candidatus Uhrbacteria bacterium RIFOXYB12_FULL_58_10]|nr:MAG: hypothetical protein A2348_00270 [Candidatus Uhrbacteria bacterium RIFOXYB12_FULL_58_10]
MPALSIASCRFRQVSGTSDPDRDAFVDAYAGIADVDSLVWVYRGGDIADTLWEGNATYFIRVVRAPPNGQMAGLVCCHPLVANVEPRVHAWIRGHDLPFSAEEAAVISCLQVRQGFRGSGIGMSLAYDAIRWARHSGFTRFLLQAPISIARKPDGLCFRICARQVARLRGHDEPNGIVLLHGLVSDALACDECNH